MCAISAAFASAGPAGIQSGNWSGSVGTPCGEQRFREGQLVREEERFEGWLPTGGRVEISAPTRLSPRSMAALWLSGYEGPLGY